MQLETPIFFEILEFLREKPRKPIEIARKFKLPMPECLKTLSDLFYNGLIYAKISGDSPVYALTQRGLQALRFMNLPYPDEVAKTMHDLCVRAKKVYPNPLSVGIIELLKKSTKGHTVEKWVEEVMNNGRES